MATSTTSTTLPAGTCDDIPDGPTFESIACRIPKQPRVDTRLKQIAKGLGAYQHRLGTLKARKKTSAEIRESFIAAADPIRTDTETLRDAVSCPEDTPPL